MNVGHQQNTTLEVKGVLYMMLNPHDATYWIFFVVDLHFVCNNVRNGEVNL